MKKILFLFINCLLINISPVFGADNKLVIHQFKNYLQEIKSVAIDFTQTDSHGNTAEGKLLINKPYKFRCNYYSPFPLLIIGSKNFVSLYDYDMQQVTRVKPSENIFYFLLEDKNSFDQDFIFESINDKNDIYKIKIYHNVTENYSEISFNKSTKQIQTIKIFENDNIITINFNNIIKVQNFSDDLFQLNNPEIFGPPAQLTKVEIEKKYM